MNIYFPLGTYHSAKAHHAIFSSMLFVLFVQRNGQIPSFYEEDKLNYSTFESVMPKLMCNIWLFPKLNLI